MKMLGMLMLSLFIFANFAFADDASNSQPSGQGAQETQMSRDPSAKNDDKGTEQEKKSGAGTDQSAGGSQDAQSGSAH